MKIGDTMLTNDAKFLMAKIYQNYIEKRKSGATKRDAKFVGDVEEIHQKIMSQWMLDDVLDTCFELKSHNFLSGNPGSNSLFDIMITNEGIAIMETSFRDKANAVLEYATKIKSLIPFI